MLVNLVGNAVKYTPAGGTVTVSAKAASDPPAVILRVSDTGVGIAAEDLPRLFEEFFRTETARQSRVHGTGLGLSLVKLIADAHHAQVAVESEVGRGTVFTVRLPIGGVEEG
jgi:signal transduction histidine kinase